MPRLMVLYICEIVMSVENSFYGFVLALNFFLTPNYNLQISEHNVPCDMTNAIEKIKLSDYQHSLRKKYLTYLVGCSSKAEQRLNHHACHVVTW